jgi:hypothetical protein
MSTAPHSPFLVPFKGLDAEVFELAAERVTMGLYNPSRLCCCCPALREKCPSGAWKYIIALASAFLPSSGYAVTEAWWDNGPTFMDKNRPFDVESRILALLLCAEFAREANGQE